jgi:ABC-type transport system involved in multi-copper enzyme maturation permease subunit
VILLAILAIVGVALYASRTGTRRERTEDASPAGRMRFAAQTSSPSPLRALGSSAPRSARVARRMVVAEILVIGHKRGTMAWAAVLALGSLILLYGIGAIEHASNPAKNAAAGGLEGFSNGIQMLGVFIGPLAAILIGTEAGASDHASGVFRDLVVTGRSRAALFAARIPGALAVCAVFVTIGYALVVLGTLGFAAGRSVPSAGVLVKGLGWSLLVDLAVCAVAVGVAAATLSRPATVTVLIGFQLVASPILLQTTALGAARTLLLDASVLHFAPAHSSGPPVISESTGVAALVMLGWVVLSAALGLWRTSTVDA